MANPRPKTIPGRNGFKYKARFGLIIECKDEAEQTRLFERLKAQGYKLKVVAV